MRPGFLAILPKKNVVDCVNCKLSAQQGKDSTYIGETKRPVRLRFNVHLRDALNESEGSSISDHFREYHPQTRVPIPLQITVIHKARDHPDRKIAESLPIQKRHPALNTIIVYWPVL